MTIYTLSKDAFLIAFPSHFPDGRPNRRTILCIHLSVDLKKSHKLWLYKNQNKIFKIEVPLKSQTGLYQNDHIWAKHLTLDFWIKFIYLFFFFIKSKKCLLEQAKTLNLLQKYAELKIVIWLYILFHKVASWQRRRQKQNEDKWEKTVPSDCSY